jgi:regulator of sigma E protease
VIETPGILFSALAFMLVIGPLVFFHEMGHYLAARWCGVKAEVFSIGFGRELFGWTDKRGTRWKVALWQLGGYVKFAGDMGPASTADPNWQALPEAERSKTFQSKSVWQRGFIVLAGPLANFLIAFLILGAFMSIEGTPNTPAVISVVEKGSAAEKAGLLAGDKIVQIDGTRIDRFEDVFSPVRTSAGATIPIQVVRNGRDVTLRVTPSVHREKDRFGNVYRFGRIGIGGPIPRLEPVPLAKLPGAAAAEVIDIIRQTVDGIWKIIIGRIPIDELGGPLKIAQVSGQAASLGWEMLVRLAAFVSINLGFINLLPIPMLDGGHLAFYAAEAVRRKPVSAEAQEWAFRSGLVLLLSMMLFVTFHNDFKSLGIWDRLAGLIG